MDEHSFVSEIRQTPDDIIPRLIYADFLEEQGDPRGELIRVQCELNTLPPGSPGRSDLFDHERRLLEEHAENWLRPLRDLGVQGLSAHSFRGGLLEQARMSLAEYLRNGEKLCRQAPALCRLQLRQLAQYDAQQPISFPDQITSLDLSANRLTAEWWRDMSPYLASDSVTEVNLQTNQLGGSDLLLMVFSLWPRLQTLRIGSNGLQPSDFHPDNTVSRTLQHLEVDRNPVGDLGLERLLSSRSLIHALQHLNVSGCRITSLSALSDPTRMTSLKELIIRQNQITGEQWNAAGSTTRHWLSTLSVFDTRNNRGELPVRGIGENPDDLSTAS